MTEESHRQAMNDAIRAQRERGNVPKSMLPPEDEAAPVPPATPEPMTPEPEPVPEPVPPAAPEPMTPESEPEPAPAPAAKRGFFARLFGR